MIAHEKKLKKAKYSYGLGLSLLEKEYISKIKGEFFLTLTHYDGRIEKRHIKNIIVDSCSLLIARLFACGQAAIDPLGPAHGIWVLALGTGNPNWDKSNPPDPTPAQETLEAELSRKQFSYVGFVKTDGSGLPSNVVTNIVDFQTIFTESEAVGPLMEMGMFGGDANPLIANSGLMVNYRTMAILTKPNTATLSIIFRITC